MSFHNGAQSFTAATGLCPLPPLFLECILGANLRVDAVGDSWALSHGS